MHKTQVPFKIKAQPPLIHTMRDHRVRRGFFGNHQRARYALVNDLIEFLNQSNRLNVFNPARLIGLPLSLLAAKIQMQHRGHRIHTQAIQMIVLQPKQRVIDEKTRDLFATVIKNRRVPNRVKATKFIGMFVQGCAIKFCQAVRIDGEMRGNPIQNHTNAIGVRMVNQSRKTIGRAKARGRSEHAYRLIAPRAIQWVFHHGHQL